MTPRPLVFVLALPLVFALACGGSHPAPAAPEGETPDAGSPSAEATDASAEGPAKDGDAGSSATSGSATASATPPTSAPSAPPAPTAAPEPVDECTPVGVDFEKRARPKLKDCYRDGKKKDPDLKGTVKISVDVNTLGKISSIKIVDKTLPDPVAQCMLKAIKSTPLPEASKCPGKAITIPVTFPTPH